MGDSDDNLIMDEPNPLIVLQTLEALKFAEPTCCTHGGPPSSQKAAEHMFRHALIGFIIPLGDEIDRHKMVIMALVHDITDWRPWVGTAQKQLNMDYLACNLPTGTAKDLEDYWSEYWDGKTPEARLAQELCAFEHLISLDEDGITIADLNQSNIFSPQLRKWLGSLKSSKEELNDLRNGASFGSSYWDDRFENERLLEEAIKKKSATSPLPFIQMLKDMSTIKRQGWITRGMDAAGVESNASHSWGVAIICLLCAPVEKIKSPKLGMIHDLAEIIIGDVTPAERTEKADKPHHEKSGQRWVAHISQSKELQRCFQEFEDGKTRAAQITHQADSVECRNQAGIYKPRYPLLDLSEFFVDPLEADYFQDLANLISKEEKSLWEGPKHYEILFLIGGPGVGKDTLCAKLAKALDFCLIPTGDLLRNEMERRGCRYSQFIKKSMAMGVAVPARILTPLIGVTEGLKLLFNGFPRNFDQLVTFERRISPNFCIIFLGRPDRVTEEDFKDILRDRLRKRAMSSSRSDDTETAITNRLLSYDHEKPLQIHLQRKDPSKFKKIDSTGSEEEVYALAIEAITELLQESK